MSEYKNATTAIHAGVRQTQEQENSEAIFATSSFAYGSAAEAAAKFGGDEGGNIYSRFTNPTVEMFEKRLAAMEKGEAAVATASGMAALMTLAYSLLKQGDRVVCSRNIFGSSIKFFNAYTVKFGVEVVYVDATDYDAWEAAINSNTRLCYFETPSNPLYEVVDVERVSRLARAKGALLCVDTVLATPALQNPLVQGADIVMQSATKFIDGQGRSLGGALISSKEIVEQFVAFMRSAGPTMSPFNAWILLNGLETLELRMKAHSSNALHLAKYLEQHAKVKHVNYGGLPNHKSHELAKKQQKGFGGLLSFELNGGKDAAWKFIDNVKLMSITGNLGDTKTLVTHPATTTHGRLTPEEKQATGISEGLVRISVGIEDIDDIVQDVEQALNTI
ncbi:O-succinylhomoserine sulfhydrylase [Marinomonas mediterranea]|jgi:O-succinylhomoserine sulfhydrylase|uniref:O-succinylhomoserine sulfhydrylase n=1 Tax=Marinomonas mediterranea (strain ATCC 700492 / JCM 21426 / NBRC 103028 / MMB-1) TaxID=717774 RepID=F2K3Y6_MARM1|nr:O-succinylhomoserine sulfhydrylase [Marinomonas mediterranea]ADZ91328.1 O-succinylhomoserine sulfhydrylase [Marinomonas mediterranea MMB-1]WCN09299.1 O-succinylhomoserine sulfhydrylase [Marinomonas mediterranea]WCN13381.1 O-succinylhomoserine sulfhydrylase [Marinomonas mediterranea]WCN17449.1 O-succinylhomoserine sulfhydrylase [Marinomonas mediterranea MMB-1]